MGCLKRRDVLFCPACGGKISPMASGPWSRCEPCGLEFKVQRQEAPHMAKLGGKTHLSECGDKIGHKTLQIAFEVGVILPPTPHRDKNLMVFYECRFCHLVHIGHESKRRRKNSSMIGVTEYHYSQIIAEGGIEEFIRKHGISESSAHQVNPV